MRGMGVGGSPPRLMRSCGGRRARAPRGSVDENERNRDGAVAERVDSERRRIRRKRLRGVVEVDGSVRDNDEEHAAGASIEPSEDDRTRGHEQERPQCDADREARA